MKFNRYYVLKYNSINGLPGSLTDFISVYSSSTVTMTTELRKQTNKNPRYNNKTISWISTLFLYYIMLYSVTYVFTVLPTARSRWRRRRSARRSAHWVRRRSSRRRTRCSAWEPGSPPPAPAGAPRTRCGAQGLASGEEWGDEVK